VSWKSSVGCLLRMFPFCHSLFNMGAEESTMYPAQERRLASDRPSSAMQSTTTNTRRRLQPKQTQQTLVPQAVLLVGYTPDGAPIFMSNPTQNTVASITSTYRSQSNQPQAPIYETQTAVAPTLISTSGVTTTVPIGTADANLDALTTILQTQTPVVAVPKTILGPDGKPYTALVRPTSSTGASLSSSLIVLSISFF
jgi:hypothetical protein